MSGNNKTLYGNRKMGLFVTFVDGAFEFRGARKGRALRYSGAGRKESRRWMSPGSAEVPARVSQAPRRARRAHATPRKHLLPLRAAFIIARRRRSGLGAHVSANILN